ncbi:hypothetical protein [Mucilaginibacter ginsenosidivorans]|uniref:Uncharacterized protein n=1 Tax=Mucilaginibacter ginsenosidivorans TaxID=398053 RepID=A0A5B8V0H2_9SPHI|nr:hypothetical protein [Mucilaginibacter ginsenosidivorans]QEC64930.1 hypothetical protein FRZ54_20945 [Mucilaginibacter ginsenosidivorans]
MIEPGDEMPLDDLEGSDKEDQMSQQDIHSTGIDPSEEELEKGKEADADLLKQSFDAAESAYTLNLDDDIPPEKKDKE